MDLAKYQQSLINIRSKYSQERFNSSKQAEITFALSGNNESIYQTPRKPQKQEPRVEVKARKGRIQEIETALSRNERQLTERVQRNKQLLSRSKEVRESEGKRNIAQSPLRTDSSHQKNVALPTAKENRAKQGQIQYLKFILKGKQATEKDQSKQANRLMNQKKENFNDHFGDHRFSFGQQTPKREKDKKIQIKTPIAPPKQIEVCVPIDSNSQTKRIQQRIQMILSR